MTDTVIDVQGLSKRYRIGSAEKTHDTLGGALADVLTRPVKNLRRLRSLSSFGGDSPDSESVIWALKDVAFQVGRGEVVGVIGRNGAGKSTLLKILSRITDPTEGRVVTRGRMSSLLEVGTGFHPELTGRENVYLNGTILGMRRKEVERKFDAIVDFSGVEKFIDTPVKRYSSGMKMRLAFAVAAHLEPEILIVDEVLAVGDAAFQKRCLGKMGEVASEGRTVLFVSHNMSAINRLCTRAILLRRGHITYDGPVAQALSAYMSSALYNLTGQQTFPEHCNTDAQFLAVDLRFSNGQIVNRPIGNGEQFCINMKILLRRHIPGLNGAFYISNSFGEIVLFSDIRDHSGSVRPSSASPHHIRVSIPSPLLVPGEYTVTFGLTTKGDRFDLIRNTLCFEIINLHGEREHRPGYLDIPLRWEANNGYE